MLAAPSSIVEPIWDQLAALQPTHDDTHPLGCHRPRMPDRVVFGTLVQVLVSGCADHRIADATRSATTLRRCRDEAIAAGVLDTRFGLVLSADDRRISLVLGSLGIDGCITTAPSGGDLASRRPVDRGTPGRTRSLAVDAAGIPLGIVAAPANRHDAPCWPRRRTRCT